uniref:Pyrrolo-quinoline quinone repeat domain-containing protein n=1 Tax=uncultured bacterium contig00033 TaxID=1181522 RepID=A0A806KJF1_9BACT|nr:hypothetical protein [uncultured bacterium contig00033]
MLARHHSLAAQQDGPGGGQEGTAFSVETPFWRQAIGGAVIGQPVAQAESVALIHDGGNLRVYTWQGSPLWNYYARGRLAPFLTRSPEGTSYVCRTNGLLTALNRAGRELWQINIGEALTAPILLGWDGRLFIFTASGIRCFTASGYRLWSKALGKKISAEPRMDDGGGFYLVLESAELLRIDAFGNTLSLQLEAVPDAIVQVKADAAGPSSFLAFYSGGRAELIDASLQSRETIAFARALNPADAVSLGTNTALLGKDGSLSLVSVAERRVLWTGSTHVEPREISSGGFRARIIFDERGIYVLTGGGAAAFTAEGRRNWFLRITGGGSMTELSEEGVLYSGGADWILYAYRPEERVKTQKRVLYGPAPPGSYGTGLAPPRREDPIQSEFALARFLSRVRADLQKGEVGEREPEYASSLIEIAGSGIRAQRTSVGPAEAHILFTHKIEAIRLLSYMGSRETVPFLADLFSRERDLIVKASAAEALGRIGVDPEGLALAAFSRAIFPPASLNDPRLLGAVAAATGALCRFSGPPLSESGIRILIFLAEPDKPRSVRSAAERELKSLFSSQSTTPPQAAAADYSVVSHSQAAGAAKVPRLIRGPESAVPLYSSL